MSDDTESRDVESDAANVDAGGRAHTSSTEGHPAGDGPRTDRDTGGPTAAPDAEENLGKPGVHGTDVDAVEPDR